MEIPMRGLFTALVLALAFPALAKGKNKPPKTQPKPAAAPPAHPALCSGDYADALPPEKASAILDTARESFVFAIRNTATYERIYYGRDGKLRRAYLRSLVHGTGFAYRILNGETHLVTNEHVASQPEVTDEDHPVDGVPTGSKKVREQLKIVRDETDDYEPGHVLLTKLLVDPQADIAVLKARKLLPVMPYRVGRSGALRAGNLVQVRGFPLGAFATLKVPKREPAGAHNEITAQDRDRLVKQLLAETTRSLTFPFGGRSVVVVLNDSQTIRFSILDEDYPLSTRETMALVDRGANG